MLLRRYTTGVLLLGHAWRSHREVQVAAPLPAGLQVSTVVPSWRHSGRRVVDVRGRRRSGSSRDDSVAFPIPKRKGAAEACRREEWPRTTGDRGAAAARVASLPVTGATALCRPAGP